MTVGDMQFQHYSVVRCVKLNPLILNTEMYLFFFLLPMKPINLPKHCVSCTSERSLLPLLSAPSSLFLLLQDLFIYHPIISVVLDASPLSPFQAHHPCSHPSSLCITKCGQISDIPKRDTGFPIEVKV